MLGRLEALTKRYDEKFEELERKIEAYFRAQKPLLVLITNNHVRRAFP
ncbi:MAG: hypothetical protein QXQ28_07340 [Candidatus Nezhaarchaeales archaeon]